MKKLDKPVLAHGESGHSHVLTDDKVEVFEMDDGSRTFNLLTDTPLVHEEHKQIVITKEMDMSDRVLEYNHFEEEAKRVQD